MHMRRKLARSLEERKNLLVASLYANSNYDGEGSNQRHSIISQWENQHEEAVRMIYSGESFEEEIPEDNPFFAAMKVPKLEIEDATTDEIRSLEDYVSAGG